MRVEAIHRVAQLAELPPSFFGKRIGPGYGLGDRQVRARHAQKCERIAGVLRSGFQVGQRLPGIFQRGRSGARQPRHGQAGGFHQLHGALFQL